MPQAQPTLIKPRIRLRDFDPADTGGLEKEAAQEQTEACLRRIGELQPRFFARGDRGLLVVLQGMDTSGKDGATRRLLDYINPAGVECTAFKVPTPEERSHDFLWRIHKAVPRRGNIGVWNRSHYEDVLVVRVLDLVPKDAWRRRYDQINEFEAMLEQNGYLVLKFFLHISKDEQARRLQARLDDRSKQWKFATGDLAMREHWDDFQEAYEDALNACSPRDIPWHLVPANRKWYRDFVIARTVCETLEDLDLKWPKPPAELKKIQVV